MKGEELFLQQGASLLAESSGCSVWRFFNESGEGTMTCYDVMPGVMLSYNDFHMEYFDSNYVPDRRMLAIDHCREGRKEYTAAENAFSYVSAGSIQIDRRVEHTGHFVFPSSHYHGLTVAFDLDVAERSLPEYFKDFDFNFDKLMDKFGLGNYPVVLSEMRSVEKIFGELYNVPENIRLPYFRLKIAELLLYLQAVELTEDNEERPYFYRTQVEKVKAVRKFITEHLSENFTQAQLSQRFGIPLTPMKNCFKTVYGMSIGQWLTDFRMNYAAELLCRGDKSVAEIAGCVGYDSTSKFAAAFRKVMGRSPTEYRSEKR